MLNFMHTENNNVKKQIWHNSIKSGKKRNHQSLTGNKN